MTVFNCSIDVGVQDVLKWRPTLHNLHTQLLLLHLHQAVCDCLRVRVRFLFLWYILKLKFLQPFLSLAGKLLFSLPLGHEGRDPAVVVD